MGGASKVEVVCHGQSALLGNGVNQQEFSGAQCRVPLTDSMSKPHRRFDCETCGLCKGLGTIRHPGLCIPFPVNGCEMFFGDPNY